MTSASGSTAEPPSKVQNRPSPRYAMRTMSRQDVRDDLAVDVGEPPVGAVVAEGEFLVIDSQQVQHRGMKVVSCRGRLCGFPGPRIAFSAGDAAFDAAAGHPTDERAAVVVASF